MFYGFSVCLFWCFVLCLFSKMLEDAEIAQMFLGQLPILVIKQTMNVFYKNRNNDNIFNLNLYECEESIRVFAGFTFWNTLYRPRSNYVSTE